LENAIYNGGPVPEELESFVYRREFGLSAQQLADEPMDQFFTNLLILRMIKDKQRLEDTHG